MTGTDRFTDALAGLRDYHDKGKPEFRDPQALAEAQVQATLAQAAATALQAILPHVGGDSDEVTQWAKLLLPGYGGGRRYTQKEWFEVLGEDAPDLPLKVGSVEVNTDEAADGTPVLDMGAGKYGARLTAVQAERLGLALLKWSHRVPFVAPSADAPVLPEYWPPHHGDRWRDRHGDNWLYESHGTLVRIGTPADDFPDEVLAAFGPLTLVGRVVDVGEVPF